MRLLFALALLLTLLAPALADEPDADSPENKVTNVKLQKIILPRVNFEKLDIAAAVEFLSEASKEQDVYHSGVKFRLDLPADPAKFQTFHREISITLTDVPLSDTLGYIAQQTNLTYHIVKGVVVLSPVPK